jgi:hypothetical protein
LFAGWVYQYARLGRSHQPRQLPLISFLAADGATALGDVLLLRAFIIHRDT